MFLIAVDLLDCWLSFVDSRCEQNDDEADALDGQSPIIILIDCRWSAMSVDRWTIWSRVAFDQVVS